MKGCPVLACALAACGSAHAPAPSVGNAVPTPRWCIDVAHPDGTAISLVRDGATGRLETASPIDEQRILLAEVEEDDRGSVRDQITVGIDCGARPCDPQVVRAPGDGSPALAMSLLPGADGLGPSGGASPFDVDWVSIEDDGNGARDVWTSYALHLGGDVVHRLAVFSLPDLSLRMSVAYQSSACTSTLTLADADCDGHADLVLDDSCGNRVFAWKPDGSFAEAVR